MTANFLASRLCVSGLLWRERSAEEMARSLLRLRVRRIELAAASPSAPPADRAGHFVAGGANDRLFNLLAEAGATPTALRLTGLSYAEKIEAIEEAGARGFPAVVDRVETLLYPDLVDRVRVYVQCATGAGVQLVLENDFYTSCDNAEAQVALLKSLHYPPGLGFCFVPTYALLDGRDPADEVRRLGRALRIAYLRDASPRMRVGVFAPDFDPGPGEDQTPGGGSLDWTGYFKALGEVGFRGLLGLAWEGTAGWSLERIERAVADSVEFCRGRAREAGLDW